MEYLTADNWSELFDRFPGLECAMLSMAHRNELEVLKRNNAAGRLNDWERRRLDELRALILPGMDY